MSIVLWSGPSHNSYSRPPVAQQSVRPNGDRRLVSILTECRLPTDDRLHNYHSQCLSWSQAVERLWHIFQRPFKERRFSINIYKFGERAPLKALKALKAIQNGAVASFSSILGSRVIRIQWSRYVCLSQEIDWVSCDLLLQFAIK